jgi:PAS domain-containing protein
MAAHADPRGTQDDADVELLRFAIDSASEGLLLVDSDLKILYVNPAAAGMVGIPVKKPREANALGTRYVLEFDKRYGASKCRLRGAIASGSVYLLSYKSHA